MNGTSNTHTDTLNPSEKSFVLTGHSAEVFACDFSSSGMLQVFVLLNLILGDVAASAGFDRTVMLWNITEGFNNNLVMRGHTNAILQVKFAPRDPSKILTASADKSVAWWDTIEGDRVKKLTGHTSIVNCCAMSKQGVPLGFSGGDDGTIKLWDMRDKKCGGTMEHSYQILSLDTSPDGNRIYAGTIDDSVLVCDVRNMESPVEVISSPEGYMDSVCGVAVSGDGDSLISLSMNGTAHLWDVRPFCESGDRLLYTYHKIVSNFEMNLLRIHWSPDDMLFSVGSSDQSVNVHKVRPDINDMDTLVCKLPGHEGTVHESVFHPKERYAVLNASSDKNLSYLAGIAS